MANGFLGHDTAGNCMDCGRYAADGHTADCLKSSPHYFTTHHEKCTVRANGVCICMGHGNPLRAEYLANPANHPPLGGFSSEGKR